MSSSVLRVYGRRAENYCMGKEKESIREVLPIVKAFAQGSKTLSMFRLF